MKHLLTILALMASAGASAQSISTDDARQRAAEFFTTQSAVAGSHRAPAKVDPVLAYTVENDATPCFYVFNRAADVDGFVIINADAEAELPILGYSESTTFNAETLPDNFRWWLDQYKENGVSKAPAKAGGSRHDVEPIVKTTWDQTAPFNKYVPHGNFVPFVTGCTSTALAQIMKHHEWPKQGKGSNRYTVTYNQTTPIEFSADFNTTYDWANMIDNYTGSYSEAQGDAVAKLMYHVGVAERTIFGSSSSADDRHGAQALIRNFGYDASMMRAERQFFTDEEWENIVYDELAEGRPLMYSGSSAKVGHAFVCDGYQASDNTYHINWGWSGSYDGYFRLTGTGALKPSGTGTGGGAAGSSYTNSQSINYNIRPNEGGEAPVQMASYNTYYLAASSGGYTSYTVDCANGDEGMYLYIDPYNFGISKVSAMLGIRFHHKTTGEEVIVPYRSCELNGGGYINGYMQAPFYTDVFAKDGAYDVTPVYRNNYDANDEWHTLISALDSSQPAITLQILNTANRPAVADVPHLTITSIEVCNDGVYDGNSNIANINYANESGVKVEPASIYFRFRADNGYEQTGSFGYSYVDNGESHTRNFSLDVNTVCTVGRVYTVELFTDKNYTKPFNIPSFSFLYSSPNPTAQEVVSAVRELKGGRGNVQMIEALVNKLLGK